MAKHKTKTASPKSEKSFSTSQIFRLGLDLDDGRSPDRPARPYAQCEWVYICVNAIIEACKSIQMMISTAAEDIVESGPAYDLLFNNPELPFSCFITETAGFLSLYRQCYWIFTERQGLRPTRLMVVGPNQLKPEIQNGQLLFYRFYPAGSTMQTLLIDDVWPLRGFNPDSKFIGVGPTDAGEIAISTAHQAALFNEASMANGGKLAGLITLPAGVRLEDSERQALLAQFEARHKGARNAGKWALMTGGADVKTLSQTMADLQMLDLREFDAKTICSLLGVPAEVVNLASEAQYAHGPAQQRFILNTISSLLSFIAENITLGILRPWRYQKENHKSAAASGSKIWMSTRKNLKKFVSFRSAFIKAVGTQAAMFAWFAVEEHPTVKEMLQEQVGKVLEYTKSGVTLNDLGDAFDLPFNKYSWGDDWWISMGQVPARYILEGGIEALTGPAMPEGQADEVPEAPPAKSLDKTSVSSESSVASYEKSLRIWRKWAASWFPIEQQMTEAIRGLLRGQFKELRGKLADALGESKSVKANPDDIYEPAKSVTAQAVRQKANPDDIIARVVFDISTANKKIKVINHVFFEKASILGIAQTLDEVAGLKADALQAAVNRIKVSPAVRRALEISSTKITKVTATTQSRVANQLRIGLEESEGLTSLTDRIQLITEKLKPVFSRERAGRIARTQVSGGVSAGRHAGMQDAGVEKKGWLSSRDIHVRDDHKTAERDYRDGIPLDQPFLLGDKKEHLMYPADPAGSPAQIANCRCLQIAVFARGKAFDLDFYDRLKFVHYDEIKPLLSEV